MAQYVPTCGIDAVLYYQKQAGRSAIITKEEHVLMEKN